MNTIADAMKKAGINPVDFKNQEIDEKQIECELRIEFLEKYMNLLNHHASEKELYTFATSYGYLSQKHLNLYLSICDDVDTLRDEIEDLRECLPPNKIKEMEAKLAEKELMSIQIKNKSYYKQVMRMMGYTDVSPHGVNLLKP